MRCWPLDIYKLHLETIHSGSGKTSQFARNGIDTASRIDISGKGLAHDIAVGAYGCCQRIVDGHVAAVRLGEAAV